MPLITVIIPAYNAEPYLDKAIQSVIGQTFCDWELIIVDDGSSDGTAAICDSYAAADSRIRVIHQNNAGVSEARNRAIEASAGKYVAFLDADDWFEPEALEELVNCISAHHADCSAFANYLTYPDGHSEYENPPLPAGYYDDEAVRQFIVRPLLCERIKEGFITGYVVRYLFSREKIIENGIKFSGAYLEDEIFLIEYFSTGVSIVITDKALYHYLQNPASVTRKYLPDIIPVFMSSLSAKRELIRKFSILVSDTWELNTCWAGLLIVVANEFAPGNEAGFFKKVQNLKAICAYPEFASAIREYDPVGMNPRKALVAKLIRKRQYLPLALLYTLKNRKR